MDVDAVQLAEDFAGVALRALASRTGDDLAAALPGRLGRVWGELRRRWGREPSDRALIETVTHAPSEVEARRQVRDQILRVLLADPALAREVAEALREGDRSGDSYSITFGDNASVDNVVGRDQYNLRHR